MKEQIEIHINNILNYMLVGKRLIYLQNIEVLVDLHGCKFQNIILKELDKQF